MDTNPIAEEAENIVNEAVLALITPWVGECLACYVARQLNQFGCDSTHRFALYYRDMCAPGATALLDRLAAMGACCCDCEMLLNAYEIAERFWKPGTWLPGTDGGGEWREPEPPEKDPPCWGVRRGSTKPCTIWERIVRG